MISNWNDCIPGIAISAARKNAVIWKDFDSAAVVNICPCCCGNTIASDIPDWNVWRGMIGRFKRVFFCNLDEILTLAYLLLLLSLGLWRGSPVFENIGKSGLSLKTLQIFGVLLCLAAVWSRHSIRRLAAAWLPFVLALMIYEGLKHMHATVLTLELGIVPIDSILRNIDKTIFGGALASEVATRLIGNADWVRHLLMCFYAMYYFMPALVLAFLYFRSDDAGFLEVRRGIVICLYGGYVMYIVLPAAGPAFDLSLLGHVEPKMLQFYEYTMTHLRYQFDCFPSLHTALPWTVVSLSWKRVPKAVKLFLVVWAIGSSSAAVGLGFHYGIDVLAGLLWATLAAVAARWTMQPARARLGPRHVTRLAGLHALQARASGLDSRITRG